MGFNGNLNSFRDSFPIYPPSWLPVLISQPLSLAFLYSLFGNPPSLLQAKSATAKSFGGGEGTRAFLKADPTLTSGGWGGVQPSMALGASQQPFSSQQPFFPASSLSPAGRLDPPGSLKKALEGRPSLALNPFTAEPPVRGLGGERLPAFGFRGGSRAADHRRPTGTAQKGVTLFVRMSFYFTSTCLAVLIRFYDFFFADILFPGIHTLDFINEQFLFLYTFL